MKRAIEACLYIYWLLLQVHDVFKDRTWELVTAVSSGARVSLLCCAASGWLTAPRYTARAYASCNLKWVLTMSLCYFGIVKRSRNVAMEINLVLVFIVSDLSRAVESLWRCFKGRGSYSKTEKGEKSCSLLHGNTSMEAFCVNCIISLYISPCWDWILAGTKSTAQGSWYCLNMH